MSQSLERPFAPTATVSLRSATNGFALWLTRVLDGVLEWSERRQQRRDLMALPDHLLADIGISRADALREADKPCWRC